MRRLPEALAVAIGGGALAGATGWLIGLAIPAAIVGLIHGFLAGYRRIYPWREWRGWVGFALDHSWGLITALGSLISHLVAAVSKTARPVPELSERQGRHVYLGGLQLRPGFVLTVGNAISGARHLERESKQRLIRIHEMSHVWQTRWFGPIFPLVYLVWGIVVGLVCIRRRPRHEAQAARQLCRGMDVLLESVRMVGVQPRGPLATEGRPGRRVAPSCGPCPRAAAGGAAAARGAGGGRRNLTQRPQCWSSATCRRAASAARWRSRRSAT